TLYTLVLLMFIDPLVNLATNLVKDKEKNLEEVSYIDERFLKTPSIAIEQALKELNDMLILAKENLGRSFASLVNEDMSESKIIASVEDRIDFLTNKLTSFFIKISSVTKLPEDEILIGGLHHVTNDIERLGDYAVLIVKETNYMKQNDVRFLDQTKAEFDQIYRYVSEMFDLAYDAFTKRTTKNLKKISSLQNEINILISSTRDVHVVRLGSGMYPVEVSNSIYSVLFSLQRISDHIVNIAFSIRSTTGSKAEAFQVIEREERKIESADRKASRESNMRK
ncbi:MAG: Na/Pi cotransporter family protein, partial [Clostridiales bacterium]|nr:Na/Pi cotransporter family protein [Clostridiales bacterium]